MIFDRFFSRGSHHHYHPQLLVYKSTGMPLARQNALKTLPTSDSLPTFPSNKPSRTSSKVSLKVLLARGIHVAGAGAVRGEVEVSVKDRAIGLGEIGIELNGVEGRHFLSSRGVCATIWGGRIARKHACRLSDASDRVYWMVKADSETRELSINKGDFLSLRNSVGLE